MQRLKKETAKSLDNFYRACQEQEVVLHGRMLSMIKNGGEHWAEAAMPTGLLAMIHRAGKILRDNPKESLADSMIDPALGFSPDVATQALIGMVNASIQPETPLPRDIHFNCEPADPLEFCTYADYAFLRTFIKLMNLDEQGQIESGCQVYNYGNQPVLVRKYLGEPTAISLREVYINGIPYPAGSIMSLESPNDMDSLPEPRPINIDIFLVKQIGRIAFLRLSAFALPPDQRRNARFVPDVHAREDEATIFMNVNLSDFEMIVEDAQADLAEIHENTRWLGEVVKVA